MAKRQNNTTNVQSTNLSPTKGQNAGNKSNKLINSYTLTVILDQGTK
jgi:hypothetical protein